MLGGLSWPTATNSYARTLQPARRRTVWLTAKPRCRFAPSLRRVRRFTSAPGYGIVYNSLDNNKNPTNGIYFNFGQDFAGAGGDNAYMKTIVDIRTYYEVVSDLVGIAASARRQYSTASTNVRRAPFARAAAAATCACSTTSRWGRILCAASSRRASGRAISLSARPTIISAAPNYWGASLEFQYPFYFLPKDFGFRGAVFADAGSVWGYRGETQYLPTGEINGTSSPMRGRCRHFHLLVAAWPTTTARSFAPRSAPA